MNGFSQNVLQHAKNHFIPHKGNDYHPHVLHHRFLVAYSVFAILLKAAATIAVIALPASSLFADAITPNNIIELTNAARASRGLSTLLMDDRLMRAAQAKANDMLANQYFAHTSPSGIRPWDWMTRAGYRYLYSGENLAVHYGSSETVQEGWMQSAGHRANILNSRYTQIGVAISSGQFEGAPSIFVVEMFGKPLDESTVVSTTTMPVVHAVTSTAPTLSNQETKPSPPVAVRASEQPATEPDLRIIPSKSGFVVQGKVPGAQRVYAALDGHETELVQHPQSQDWSGIIQSDSSASSTGARPVTVLAWSADGGVQTHEVANVLLGANVVQAYAGDQVQNAPVKLFGLISVQGLQDGVRQTFVICVVVLLAALLLMIFIRFEIQNPSVIAHALAVIGLSMFLLFL